MFLKYKRLFAVTAALLSMNALHSVSLAKDINLLGETSIVQMMDDCITDVERGTLPNFSHRTKVPDDLTNKTLRSWGRAEDVGKVSFWRTAAPTVIQFGYLTPQLCGGVGFGLNEENLIEAFNSWSSQGTRGYVQKNDFKTKLPSEKVRSINGFYLAKKLTTGDYVQVSMSVHIQSGQTTITVSRVPYSPAAAELIENKSK